MKLYTEEVVKKYRSRTVVNRVSVEVSQGEIVGLLGPNGAGKTTTFYMIVGIIKPFSGRVFLDERDITRLPMYRRAQMGVGYLAQEASVFRQMSVEDNILSILQFRRDLDREGRQAKLESLISEFGLEKIRRSKGIQLSGGERRRTEIARALANDPKFLKDRNIGILITDHNVHETLAITDRAYLLYEGTVLHHGTPEQMAADPDVRAKYLGRDFVLRRARTQDIS